MASPLPILERPGTFWKRDKTLVHFDLNFAVAVVGHTIYTRNNMGQKCEGNCGLWVPNEILKKSYPENLKKIVGAV